MSQDAAAKIAARLDELWRTSRPVVLERVAVLQTAYARLAADREDAGARTSGHEAAHKLAGVLGVFGLPRGSELASQIESLLASESRITSEEVAALDPLIAELDSVIAAKSESH